MTNFTKSMIISAISFMRDVTLYSEYHNLLNCGTLTRTDISTEAEREKRRAKKTQTTSRDPDRAQPH